MGRPGKTISIDDAILAQEEAVTRAKLKYEAEADKLKDLLAKRDEARRKVLLDAIEKSSHTYEEILAFLQSGESEDE